MNLPFDVLYFGLLWGSVDTYNTLTFFDGATQVGSITGTQINASANGDQGSSGTFYVNVTSDLVFNKVVGSSTQFAFEVDNFAFNRAGGEAGSQACPNRARWLYLGSAFSV